MHNASNFAVPFSVLSHHLGLLSSMTYPPHSKWKKKTVWQPKFPYHEHAPHEHHGAPGRPPIWVASWPLHQHCDQYTATVQTTHHQQSQAWVVGFAGPQRDMSRNQFVSTRNFIPGQERWFFWPWSKSQLWTHHSQISQNMLPSPSRGSDWCLPDVHWEYKDTNTGAQNRSRWIKMKWRE